MGEVEAGDMVGGEGIASLDMRNKEGCPEPSEPRAAKGSSAFDKVESMPNVSAGSASVPGVSLSKAALDVMSTEDSLGARCRGFSGISLETVFPSTTLALVCLCKAALGPVDLAKLLSSAESLLGVPGAGEDEWAWLSLEPNSVVPVGVPAPP